MSVRQMYMGLPIHAIFVFGHWNGYVEGITVQDPQGRPISMETLEEMLGEDATPHGGFTANLGFDCGHFYDIVLHEKGGKVSARRGRTADSSFKTWRFALSEAKRIVRGLRALEAAKRIVLHVENPEDLELGG